MARHRLLPAGEAGRGMAQLRADRGGRGITRLHGAPAQEGGDTAAITKRGRAAEPTARPVRQGAGTGPDNGWARRLAVSALPLEWLFTRDRFLALGWELVPLPCRHDLNGSPV